MFSTVGNIFHSKKDSATYYHKRTYFSVQCTGYSCHILFKLEFSQHVSEKKTRKKSHFSRIDLVGVELFDANELTDGPK